jgi:hypothetical protein
MRDKLSVQNVESENLHHLQKVLAASNASVDGTKVSEDHRCALVVFQDERLFLLE